MGRNPRAKNWSAIVANLYLSVNVGGHNRLNQTKFEAVIPDDKKLNSKQKIIVFTDSLNVKMKESI